MVPGTVGDNGLFDYVARYLHCELPTAQAPWGMYDFIFAMLMTLAPYAGDIETEKERAVRLSVIAKAIETSSTTIKWSGSQRELATLLIVQGWSESRFAKHVHEGKCRVKQGECDAGRAVSPWQLHAGYSFRRAEWKSAEGADLKATTVAAKRAAQVLSRGRNFCKSIQGAISLYATGASCRWKGAASRLSLFRRLRGTSN